MIDCSLTTSTFKAASLSAKEMMGDDKEINTDGNKRKSTYTVGGDLERRHDT